MLKRVRKKTQWWRHREPANWKSSESVLRVALIIKKPRKAGDPSGPIQLGQGFRGTVYLGTVFFKEQSKGPQGVTKKTVAIKKFHDPLNDIKAKMYSKVINELRKLKFPIPKTGMYKITANDVPRLGGLFVAGEWVQIQQGYARSGRTKIVDRNEKMEEYLDLRKAITKDYSHYYELMAEIKKKGKGVLKEKGPVGMLFSKLPNARTDSIILLTKLANLGMRPKFDFTAPLIESTINKTRAIPFDIDLFVEERLENHYRKPSVEELALILARRVQEMAVTPRERKRLWKLVESNSNKPLKEVIERIGPDYITKVNLLEENYDPMSSDAGFFST